MGDSITSALFSNDQRRPDFSRMRSKISASAWPRENDWPSSSVSPKEIGPVASGERADLTNRVKDNRALPDPCIAVAEQLAREVPPGIERLMNVRPEKGESLARAKWQGETRVD